MATIHPNYIKSSNLLFLSIIIGFISLAIAQVPLKTLPAVLSVAVTVGVMALIAFLVRKGISWVKYVLLVLTVLGVAGLIMGKQPASNVALAVNIIQTLIQLWALIILFTIPKSQA
jgi:multidrug transporter EmrE-like cation transporter